MHPNLWVGHAASFAATQRCLHFLVVIVIIIVVIIEIITLLTLLNLLKITGKRYLANISS